MAFSRTHNRLLSALASLLGCVLIVSACSSPSSGGQGQLGGDDETVTFAVADFENDSFDPAMKTTTGTRSAKYLMWDSLLELGPDGGIAPGMAESWEMSPDGLTWIFKIRQGVTFHNGEPLTADDVKFSIDRFKDSPGVGGGVELANAQIASVDVIDEYTVAVHTKGPQPSLPYVLSPHESIAGIVLPKDYLLNEGGPTFEEQRQLLERAPIGSGPFRFVERTAGDRMLFERIDHHWRVTPKVKRIEILRVTEEATQVAMLQSGEVDIISISPDQAEPLQSAGLELRTIPQSNEIGLFFPGSWRDSAKPKPTANVLVRKALSLAIDRQAIIDSVLAGKASPKTTPWNTAPATSDVDEAAFKDWAAEANAYDPERARALLAEAGYPNGFDDIQLFTFARPGVPALPQIAEIVAAQWADVGVNARLVPTDYNSYQPHFIDIDPQDTYNAGDANLWGTGPRFGVFGALTSYVIYEGGVARLVQDPAVDDLVRRASTTLDERQRRALVTQAYDRFLDQWVSLPIAMMDTVYAVNPDTVGTWTTTPGYPFLGRTLETIQEPQMASASPGG
jgi:peptide/nickel transport system substrate-binding protein